MLMDRVIVVGMYYKLILEPLATRLELQMDATPVYPSYQPVIAL